MNNRVKWILKNGSQVIECNSFPYAFRNAYNIIRKALDKNENIGRVMSGITIVGPPNGKGEPMIYTYTKAVDLAKSMGLLLADGTLDQKNMKFDRVIGGITKKR
jgi:hypothetical protein